MERYWHGYSLIASLISLVRAVSLVHREVIKCESAKARKCESEHV